MAEKKSRVARSVTKVTKPRVKDKSLSVPLYTLEGKEGGLLELPEEIFRAKVNKALLLQAVRVYSGNLKAHFAHTKTRSEVRGSSRKIRAQKGTGGARHGSIRAPIFVGGGVAQGPKFRKVVLDLPQKMKTAALKSALSSKLQAGEVIGVGGLEAASGKTKQMQVLMNSLTKNNLLLVLGDKNEKVIRSVRNLPRMKVLDAAQLNALEVIKHHAVALTKEAVSKLEARVLGKKEERGKTKE